MQREALVMRTNMVVEQDLLSISYTHAHTDTFETGYETAQALVQDL